MSNTWDSYHFNSGFPFSSHRNTSENVKIPKTKKVIELFENGQRYRDNFITTTRRRLLTCFWSHDENTDFLFVCLFCLLNLDIVTSSKINEERKRGKHQKRVTVCIMSQKDMNTWMLNTWMLNTWMLNTWTQPWCTWTQPWSCWDAWLFTSFGKLDHDRGYY